MGLAAVFATLMLCGPLVTTAGADSHARQGYIDATALNVRADAGVRSDIVGILLKYDEVSITGERKVGSTTWYSIEASGGYNSGWVSARFVELGAPPEVPAPAEVDYGAKETPTLLPGSFQYVGAKRCQECHDEAIGDYPNGAYGVWKGHFHSNAYATLGRDYTKEIAKRVRGVDDPANDWRCVKCHTTALGAGPSRLGPDYTQAEGVGCEVCHGPGGSYADEDHGPEVANREAMGFRVLRNLDERREVCTSCHNAASPTFIGFDLRQFSRKIAHWVDDDDDSYRAEAGREAARRAQALSGAATAGGGAGATAKAKAAGRAAQGRAEAEAASRAARERADAEAARRADDARKAASAAEAERARMAEKEAERRAEEEKAAAMAAAERKAEAERRAEAERKADAERRAEAERKADAERRAEAERKADAERRAEAERKADAERRAEAERKADAERRAEAERKAEAERRAEAERKAEAERRAEAERKAEAERRAEAERAAPVIGDNPLAHFLDDIDDVIVLNTGGKKYKSLKFPHKKHAGNDYLPGGDCQTCHHTQEGNESPESCNTCHEIDGDAEETKAKKRFAHTKKKPFPMAPDQEEVSCVGCHKSMNAMLKAGERQGDKAPTKCTTCHAKQ